MYRGARQPRFTRPEQLATEVLYDHVLLALRSVCLREQLTTLPRSESGGPAGSLVLSAEGELLRWDGASRELVASIAAPEGTWTDWLVHQAVDVVSTPPGRSADERVFTLPRSGGGWVEVRLSRLTEGPGPVVVFLRHLEAGTQGHFDAATSHARLTGRERAVTRLVVQGLSDREVGLELGIQPRSVGVHLMRVYDKLGVVDRQALRMRVLGPTTPRLVSATPGADGAPGKRVVLELEAAGAGHMTRVLATARERAAAAGLTTHEQQVAVLAALGRSNQEIASELGKSPNTVKDQLGSIFRKTRLLGRDRLAAVLLRDELA